MPTPPPRIRAENVDALRLLRGLTWAELARKAKVPSTFLQDLRRGRGNGAHSPHYVEAIAQALGVRVDRLLDAGESVVVNGRRLRARPPVTIMSERIRLAGIAVRDLSDEADLAEVAAVIEKQRAHISAVRAFASKP